MKLLITRPADDAETLVTQLQAIGIDSHRAPLMTIVATPQNLPAVATVGGIAFTSANGVRALAAQISDPTWQALPAYCVGPQTLAAAQLAGFTNSHQGGGDVAALAELIGQLHGPQAKPVLHIAGSHVAGNLLGLLAQAGITAQKAVLYEAREITAFDAETAAALGAGGFDGSLDGVVLYSQRSARVFLALWGQLDAPKLTAYCLSPVIGELMQAHGFEVAVAAQPDEKSMLALLAESQ